MSDRVQKKTRRELVKPQPPRAYPSYYELAVSFGGFALVASEGKHHGAVMGTLYPDHLALYGLKNFDLNGGLAWQKGRTRRYLSPSGVVGLTRSASGRWWWLMGAPMALNMK